MKRIAVLTSGGDAPGMNACIRAVVRQTISIGGEAFGVRRGFEGLIDNEIIPLTSRSVGSVMRYGGTFLQTARSTRFLNATVRADAAQVIADHRIDGLVVIGGNGSFQGALKLSELGVPVVGVPASIDNDMGGTEMAIGVDTCLNTILDCLDKIKDTAGSLRRPFIVEVMGRECGYLALLAGLAGGAEMVVTPEQGLTLPEIEEAVEEAYSRGKPMFIALVAEGAPVKAAQIYEYLSAKPPKDGGGPRLTILGHIQRGGSPSAFDRILATRFGVAAVNALADGKNAHMVGLRGSRIAVTPLSESISCPAAVDPDLHSIAATLAH